MDILFSIIAYFLPILTCICTAAIQAVPGLTKAHQDSINNLFDKYVDGGLAWVRKQGSEYIPSVDNNLTTSLALLLQVRCGRYGTSITDALCLACIADAGYLTRTLSAVARQRLCARRCWHVGSSSIKLLTGAEQSYCCVWTVKSLTMLSWRVDCRQGC
eukprot:GHUV01032058.1.p1 GENE.GHUV01032058.1~~GHUV01032058.1.p1  ORF type:complete len:159 (+),score=16.16 GHUV01032058.1:318-794(+)